MEWHNFLLLSLILQLYTRREVDGKQPQRCTGGELQELERRQDCVCNSQTLVEFFNSGMGMSPSMVHRASEVMTKRINAYFCHEYIKLPDYLTIEMTDSVPSPYFRRKLRRKFLKQRKHYRQKRDIGENIHLQVHHRIKRQIYLGYPTNEKWDQIIPHLPKHGRHYYVPIGSLVSLKCYAGHDGDNDEASVEDQVIDGTFQFEWRHANGMEITAPYVITDRSTGDLKFHSVRLSDTGIYNCTMKTEDEPDPQVFQSQVDVVAGPTFWLKFSILYSVPTCRHKELLEIQKSVPNIVHKYACHFCSVRNISIACVDPGQTSWQSDDNKVVQLTLSMSAIGFEDTLASWTHNYMHCNLECQKGIHVKVLNVTQKSLVKLFSLPIHVVPVEGQSSIYNSLRNSHSFDLSDGCPPGFFLQYSLCFPCSPGEFSPTGPADCFPCDKGYFQPNPGSSACFHCQKGHTTIKKGSTSQMDCILESASSFIQFFDSNSGIVIWTGVCVLLIVLLLLIICCWPHSAVGRLLRCVPCCGERCCGSEHVEKEIPEDSQKLLLNEEVEIRNDDDGSPPPPPRRERRSFNQRRMHKYRQESSDGYYDDDHFSKAPQKEENVTILNTREEISEIPEYNPLDLPKHASKRPVAPVPFRRGHCSCPTTAQNFRQQDRELFEEQQQQDEFPSAPVPPPPFSEIDKDNDGAEPSDSSTKRFYFENPHLKLGSVLRKSKSLTAKLAEQRHKLRRYVGQKSETSSTRSESLSRLKDKFKNKMVKISESRNIFHPITHYKKYKDDKQEHQESRIKSKSALDRFRNRSSERVKNTVKKIQNQIVWNKKQ